MSSLRDLLTPSMECYYVPRLIDLQDCRGVSLHQKIHSLYASYQLDWNASATLVVVDLMPTANLAHPFAYGIMQPGYGPQYFLHDMPPHDDLQELEDMGPDE